MWEKVMAVNSFCIWPLTLVFLIYAAGRTVLLFQWKLLVIAIILFGLATIAQIALGILSDQ